MIDRYAKLLEQQKEKLRYMIAAGVPENNAVRVALVMSIADIERQLKKLDDEELARDL